MASRTQVRSLAASLIAWLDVAQSREALRLLVNNRDEDALDVLHLATTEFPDGFDLSDPVWREAVLDELEGRISPEDTEDPDDVKTTMVPNYAAFATDLREQD